MERKSRIIIIAPHPDDEACGCASVMLKDAAGKEIHVVYLTDGENKRSAYYAKAAVRRREARDAMKIAGAKELIFMDHPELGINTKEKFKNALEELEAIFSRIRPHEIYAPAYEGGHFDHDVANALCNRAAKADAKAYEYPMYNQEIGLLSYIWRKLRKKVMKREPAFHAPRFLANSGNRIRRARLDESEIKTKKRMLSCYRSQNTDDILIRSFVFREEAFREMPIYDYSRLPARFLIHRIGEKRAVRKERRTKPGCEHDNIAAAGREPSIKGCGNRKIDKKRTDDSFYLNITGRNRKIFEDITKGQADD